MVGPSYLIINKAKYDDFVVEEGGNLWRARAPLGRLPQLPYLSLLSCNARAPSRLPNAYL
jgi:hypothetical protein